MADSASFQPIPNPTHPHPNFTAQTLFPPLNPASPLRSLNQPFSSEASWKSKLFVPLNPSPDRALVFLEPVVDGEKQIASCRRSEIELIAKDWEGKLLGFLLGKKRPHLPSLKKTMISKWCLKSPLELSFHGNDAILLKFNSDEEKNSVLEAGPWFFSGRLLVLKPWRRHLKFSDFDTSLVPIWVRLPNLPVEFWSRDSLSRIGSLLGRPLFSDEMTASRARSSFARICVEVSALKAFPNEICIDIEGTEGFSQVVKAEWMPVRCSNCKEFFHDSRFCPLKKKSVSAVSDISQSDPCNTFENGDGSWTVVQGRKPSRRGQYVQKNVRGISLVNSRPDLPANFGSPSETVVGVVDQALFQANGGLMPSSSESQTPSEIQASSTVALRTGGSTNSSSRNLETSGSKIRTPVKIQVDNQVENRAPTAKSCTVGAISASPRQPSPTTRPVLLSDKDGFRSNKPDGSCSTTMVRLSSAEIQPVEIPGAAYSIGQRFDWQETATVLEKPVMEVDKATNLTENWPFAEVASAEGVSEDGVSSGSLATENNKNLELEVDGLVETLRDGDGKALVSIRAELSPTQVQVSHPITSLVGDLAVGLVEEISSDGESLLGTYVIPSLNHPSRSDPMQTFSLKAPLSTNLSNRDLTLTDLNPLSLAKPLSPPSSKTFTLATTQPYPLSEPLSLAHLVNPNDPSTTQPCPQTRPSNLTHPSNSPAVSTISPNPSHTQLVSNHINPILSNPSTNLVVRPLRSSTPSISLINYQPSPSSTFSPNPDHTQLVSTDSFLPNLTPTSSPAFILDPPPSESNRSNANSTHLLAPSPNLPKTGPKILTTPNLSKTGQKTVTTHTEIGKSAILEFFNAVKADFQKNPLLAKPNQTNPVSLVLPLSTISVRPTEEEEDRESGPPGFNARMDKSSEENSFETAIHVSEETSSSEEEVNGFSSSRARMVREKLGITVLGTDNADKAFAEFCRNRQKESENIRKKSVVPDVSINLKNHVGKKGYHTRRIVEGGKKKVRS